MIEPMDINLTAPPHRRTKCNPTTAATVKVGDYFPTSDFVAVAITAIRVEGETHFISCEVNAPAKYVDGKMTFKPKTITRRCEANDSFPTIAISS